MLDAVGERMRGGSAASTRLTLGGHEVLLDADWPKEGDALDASFLTGAKDVGGAGDFMRVGADELLLASSFHLASAAGTEDAPRWSLWGRGARSSFSGRDGELTLGARGALLSGAGYELAVKSDLTFVHTESEKTTGLASAEAQTRRLRLVLEGSHEVNFGSASLTPSVQVGMRYDGGDAETGAGVELGGGVRFAASGLTMEVRGRGLLAHEDRDYEEWGVSASAVFSPGSEGRGLSMRVGSAWGAASSRADRIWTGGAAGLAGEADLPGASLDAEVAYGLDALRGLLTPYTGVALSENGETWRAGARWTLGPAVTLSLEAILIEPASGS